MALRLLSIQNDDKNDNIFYLSCISQLTLVMGSRMPHVVKIWRLHRKSRRIDGPDTKAGGWGAVWI